MENTQPITIQTVINAPIETVWEMWTTPEHIMKWNAASDDWHTPRAENDLRAGWQSILDNFKKYVETSHPS